MTRIGENLYSEFVPAPTLGLNLRDPVFAVEKGYAARMANTIPEPRYVRNRGGTELFCDLSGTTTDAIDTLLAFRLNSSTEKFIACAGNNIFDITSGTASSIKGALSITRDMYVHCLFNGRLFMANGDNPVLSYTGSGNFADAGFTGFTGSTQPYVVAPYNHRLYFCGIGAPDRNLYYADTDAITGAVTTFPLGPVLHEGGIPLNFAAISTRGEAAGRNALAIIADTGEVIVYAGLDPEDSTWSIIGRGNVGTPLGRRCLAYVGSELHFITRRGIVPVSTILQGTELDSSYGLSSSLIEPVFTDFVTDSFDHAAVSLIEVPKRKYYALKMVPFPTGTHSMYTMNSTTKAWGAISDWDHRSIAAFGEELYFGTTTTGKVYKADVPMTLDPGSAAISYSYMCGSSQLGLEDRDKVVKQCKTIFTAEKASGSEEDMSYTQTFDADAEELADSFTKTGRITSSTAKLNRNIEDTPLKGQFIGSGISGSISTPSELKFYGSSLYYEGAGA